MLLGWGWPLSLCLSRDNRNTLCYCVHLLDFCYIALALTLTLAPAIGCLPALYCSPKSRKVLYCSVQWIKSEFIRLIHYFHLHSALLSNLQASTLCSQSLQLNFPPIITRQHDSRLTILLFTSIQKHLYTLEVTYIYPKPHRNGCQRSSRPCEHGRPVRPTLSPSRFSIKTRPQETCSYRATL